MSAKKSRAAREPRRSLVPLVAAAMLVAAGVSGVLAWSLTSSGKSHPAPASSPQPTPSGTPTGTPGDHYATGVLEDFGNMSGALVSYMQTLQGWRDGKVDDAQMGTVVNGLLGDVSATQQALTARAPFPAAPQALYDYRATADLYGQAALLTQAAIAVPHGELRTQVQLAVLRVQTLADRIFDQGAAEMKPFVTPDHQFDSVQIMRADEIPSFGASKLAAGPPLTDVAAAPTMQPYQTARPQEPLSDWVRLVTDAKIPSESETESAIDSGKASALAADSVTFTRASALLHAAPDPQGERNVSTRIQLALLVDAEATQAGQAATLVPAAAHEAVLHVAQGLSLIADKLWDDRLGKRTSSYPAWLLIIKYAPASDEPSANPSAN
jgi:hypothetical protein